MAKKLIITADDFGIERGINEGIIECYRNGSLSGISVLSAGGAFDHAVELAKKNSVEKIGVHLALTGPFKSVCSEEKVPTLVGNDGSFPRSYPNFFVKFFSNGIRKEDIYREFKAQILKVKNRGFKITHLNSHQHIHMAPVILKTVISLAKEEGIDYIRFPLEMVRDKKVFINPIFLLRHASLSFFCAMSKKILDEAHIKHNDYFIGHLLAHRLSKSQLEFALSSVSEGVTEFGCHPGYFTEEVKKRHPKFKNCEQELRLLCDKRFMEEIKSRSIELTTYS